MGKVHSFERLSIQQITHVLSVKGSGRGGLCPMTTRLLTTQPKRGSGASSSIPLNQMSYAEQVEAANQRLESIKQSNPCLAL